MTNFERVKKERHTKIISKHREFTNEKNGLHVQPN